ncbi:hypothetical protein [Tumebacillus flagellatus]|uniref:Uncharacterized protein n=1 Tax=Tumebacillus flagellatus TaxID=1157490 RepID=A0A074M659_9BACL|nr:hypothetical protein [Tumebacillus flagellatus]KEO81492.1 hypothetical protein EL26_20685 [Tumebacillus flagellatus]
MSATTEKVEIKLLGDPKGFCYNFGSHENPDWKSGGDVVEVPRELAVKLVLSKSARFLNDTGHHASFSEQPLDESNMAFDQSVVDEDQNHEEEDE